MKEIVEAKFKEIFGTEGRYKTYFAPGMVNLMGDNTEHNGGYTLSYTVKRGTYATVREREDRIINFYSANVEELGILSFSIDNLVLVYDPDEKWINYPKSIILTLKKNNEVNFIILQLCYIFVIALSFFIWYFLILLK